MTHLEWQVEEEMARDAAENYRTAFALSWKDRNPLDIVRQLTFDGDAPNITIPDIAGAFSAIESKFLRRPLAGIGVEVGAGPSVFSAVLAQRPGVTRMYGVEICRPIVTELAPKIVPFIAGNAQEKVVPVIGNFDHMELPDASVDFVFDFFSLHHSLDISVTMKEIHRLLKPSGFLVMFDKARPDSITDADINEMLDTIYDESFYRQFGLPLDTKLSRRKNGEREYRLRDWRNTLMGAGFSSVDHWNLQRTAGGNAPWRTVKTVISALPVSLQTVITGLLPKPKEKHKFGLSRDNRVFLSATNSFRKEISLIVAYR